MCEQYDIAIIGAGAAGLMAAIWVGRTVMAAGKSPRVVVLDGARTIGAKILVAGGGRCNVTHDVVSEEAFAGSTRPAIRKVLRRFDVMRTTEFFREIGVDLKREDTGKLFPTTDSARTVLDALLRASRDAGSTLRYPWRVSDVDRHDDNGFRLTSTIKRGSILARRIILATGGKSLPKSGSDGAGYELARRLGHTVTSRVFPALVPLLLEPTHPLRMLSGVSVCAELEVRSGSGRKLAAMTGSTLCTHFGLSGPGPLDISRHFLAARFEDAGAELVINWYPGVTPNEFDRELAESGRSRNAVSVGRFLRELRQGLPARFAETLCGIAGVDAQTPVNLVTREQRRSLSTAAVDMIVPIIGDRGFAHAEVTAGGVPLSELRLETMESRFTPGLYLIGEVCDVDGRIGGYNFQWAWSSGYIAGRAAGSHLIDAT